MFTFTSPTCDTVATLTLMLILKCIMYVLVASLLLLEVHGEDEVGENVDQSSTVRSEFIILFMFVGILLGTFSTHLLSRIAVPIPYTVLMYLEGLFLALFMQKAQLGRFGRAADIWGDVDPDLLLYCFLPVLLFGEAMNLNWYGYGDTSIHVRLVSSFSWFLLQESRPSDFLAMLPAGRAWSGRKHDADGRVHPAGAARLALAALLRVRVHSLRN